jgi:hypothetical protein
MNLLPARWFGEQKAARSLETMVHSGSGGGGLWGPLSWLFSSTSALMNSTKYNWQKEVSDPLQASVLMAPINWLMRTFPEAPLVLEQRNVEQNRWEPIHDAKVLQLIDTPNDYYSGETLLMCLALDLSFGNAFIIKIRNIMGEVIQLWWAPAGTLTPRYASDGTEYIGYWEYNVNGQTKPVPVEDVIHIRFGLDPRDARMGLSPLGSLVRETAIDEQASNFTATILKNLGIIGVIISPEVTPQTTKGKTASKDAVEAVKDYMKRNFTGDKRGDTLAVGSPTKAQLLQYNMEGFNVGPIRDVSEERVCAAMGIPAAVVGFGTGLQQTKVGATMKEMRQLAWIGGVIPMQRIVARELQRSLLPEFIPEATRATHRIRFDSAAVPLLWETPTEKHTRIREDFKAQMIKRSEARLETGRAAGPEDEVYVAGNSAQPQKPDAAPAADDKEPTDA